MYRFFSCNLESGIPLAIGIQTGIKYLETGILGVESTLWNPESKTVLNSLMHQSIPPAPSPPPPPGHLPPLSVPGVGHLQMLALPGGRASANPRTNPELLTRTRFPIRIKLQRRFYWKKSRLVHLSRTGINCRGL